MLDQVISKLEEGKTNGTVPAQLVQQSIQMLHDVEGYRAQKSKQLLEQTLAEAQSPHNSNSIEQDGDRIFIEDTLSALRALFQMQDD